MKNAKANVLAGVLVLLGACGDRSLGADWDARVLEACENVCEVSACDSHSAYFNDAAACVESCSTHEFMAKETECSLAKLDEKECLGALSCEESEARSEAIVNGVDVEIDDWACKAENLEVGEACP